MPALADAERRTQYSISATTCACSVGFPLFGSGTDVDSWIEVWLGGVRYLSTDPSHGWALSSATGTLATIPRPITNAVLTFTAVQTGTVQIIGAERPRRLSQVRENQGVAARDFNQAISDLVAVERELWDKTNDVTGRSILGLPGEIVAPLPSASARAGLFLCWDGTGLKPLGCPPLSGTGNVAGPAGAVDGHVPVFNGATGLVLRDSGAAPLLSGAGTDTNVLNAQTANYSAVTGDCGKTITLGGSAFFTLTVGAASGFNANCSIVIANIDTGRGKKLAVNGITTVGQSNILWPGQSFSLKNENNAWIVYGLPTRWVLPGTTAFFVDTAAGADTNDGLAAGAGNAFATLAKAITNTCSALDLNLQNVTITTTAATYTEHLNLCTFLGFTSQNGYAQVSVIMTGATLSAAGGNGIGIFAQSTSTPWLFKNTTFTNCGVACIEADSGGVVALDGPTFTTVTGDHVISVFQSRVVFVTNGYTVTGGATVHWLANNGGEIFLQPSKTVTCTGTPAFTFWSQVQFNGRQNWNGATFSGCGGVTTSAGRCQIDTGGGINTVGGGSSYLPGTVAVCTATTPGWYN